MANIQITIQELRCLKEVVDALNEAYPIAEPGIKCQTYEDGKLITKYVKPDPHFSGYKSSLGVFWIICDDYWIWQESFPFIKEFCKYLTQQLKKKAHPCHEHPVSLARYKREHKERKIFFIGKVSWA